MATQQQVNLNTELYRKFGTSISSDVQNDLDDINDSLSTIQNTFLPLAGGIMTGDVNLSNHNLTGANIIDAVNVIARNTLTIKNDVSFNQNDLQGQINFESQYWSESDTENGSSIKSFKATPDGNAGSYLTIHTVDTGNVLNEVVRVDQAGNVGIGINDPSVKLAVAGDINVDRNVLATTNTGLVSFGYTQSTVAGVYGGFDGTTIHGAYFQLFGKDSAGTGETPPGGGEFIINSTNGPTKFTVGVYDGATFNTKAVITSDGNLGLGNTTPTAILDIVGISGSKQLLTLKPVTNPQSVEYLAVYDINSTELFVIGANGVVDINSLYSPSISADQILIGGEVLGSAAFVNISAFDLAGSATFVQENSLPLSGGIMNQDAVIAFQNGANIGQGTTDLGIGGAKGISLRCSVEYELNYQAGRLTNFQPDGATVMSLPLGSPLEFLSNTDIRDFNNTSSIDPNARILHNANGDIMLDWSSSLLSGMGLDYSVNTEVYTNSANWNNVVNVVNSNSAINWNYQGTDVKVLTSNWQNTFNQFKTQSANNLSVYSNINSNSAAYINTYNTVHLNSASWILSGLSVETDPIFTTWALANSANFQNTYNTVNSNSSINWNYQGTDVKVLTGNWQNTSTVFGNQSANNASAYTLVNSNSAVWGGGIVINSTAVVGASANTLLINGPANNVQTILPGTGVLSAFTSPVNGANGFLTYSMIGISGATIPLLNTSTTWGGTLHVQSIIPNTDNTYSLGTAYPGNRFYAGWFSNSVAAQNFILNGGSGASINPITFNSKNAAQFTDQSKVSAAPILLGPATSAFPAFDQNGSTLLVRLGDNSGDAALKAGAVIATSGAAIYTNGSNTFSVYDSLGHTVFQTSSANTTLGWYSGVFGTGSGSIFWNGQYGATQWQQGGGGNWRCYAAIGAGGGYIGIDNNGSFLVNLNCSGAVTNRLELRNATAANSLAVYNTYTSTSNYETGVMDWQANANTLRIGSSIAGSGSARDVQFIRGDTAKFTLSANTNTHNQPAKLAKYIVSSLPAVSACGIFSICGVTDALAPVIGSSVTGGGSSNAVVVANNSAWIVMATL